MIAVPFPRLGWSRRRWLVAGVFALVLLVAALGDHGVLQLWRLRDEIEILQREVQVLEAENERLSRTITELHDDPQAIERIAREELGLVRPGERVLRFPRTPRPEGPAGSPPPSTPRSP
jgi:cell division protein FtsB